MSSPDGLAFRAYELLALPWPAQDPSSRILRFAWTRETAFTVCGPRRSMSSVLCGDLGQLI